jgi:hypothetical protein
LASVKTQTQNFMALSIHGDILSAAKVLIARQLSSEQGRSMPAFLVRIISQAGRIPSRSNW